MFFLDCVVLSDRCYLVSQVPSDEGTDLICDFAKELPCRRGRSPSKGMRALNDFSSDGRNAQLEREMIFRPDIERGEKGDAHSHHDHVSECVEACALVVPADVCTQPAAKFFDLSVEVVVLIDREHGFAFEVAPIDVLAFCESMICREDELKWFFE